MRVNRYLKATLAILDSVSHGLELMCLARSHQRIFGLDGIQGLERVWAARNRQYLIRRLSEMKRRKWLEAKRIGDRLVYSLTNEGEKRHLMLSLRRSRNRADSKSVLVVFDVPESRRHDRDAFRWFLRSSDFKMLQLSVWATRKDVGGFIGDWIKKRRLSKWIKVLIADPVA